VRTGAGFGQSQATAVQQAIDYSNQIGAGPRGVLVHCFHGADRAGAVLAYILARYEGVPIAHALWMGVNTSSSRYGEYLRKSLEWAVREEHIENPGYLEAGAPFPPYANFNGHSAFIDEDGDRNPEYGIADYPGLIRDVISWAQTGAPRSPRPSNEEIRTEEGRGGD